LDLGKSKTVACEFDRESGDHSFRTVATSPRQIRELLDRAKPDVVVFEVCTDAGWVSDQCRDAGARLAAVNPSTLTRSMHRRREKSDRRDALDLARAWAVGAAKAVHMPTREVREWRELIEQRARAVEARTRRRNQVRAMMQSLGLAMPPASRAWSVEGMLRLRAACGALPSELDRARMRVHLDGLSHAEEEIRELERLLEGIAACDARVALLRTVPGVGPRGAEATVAFVDDPRRFANARQASAYTGLSARRDQSGDMDRTGRISKAGPSRLRSILVEVAWASLRHNAWAREVYERVRRGSASRKKQAIVAVARKLFVRMWAMLRDRTEWSPTTGREAAA
jgi:transposase